MQVFCAIADVVDCGVTYQAAYSNNCIYISYKTYLIEVGAEYLSNVNKRLCTLAMVFSDVTSLLVMKGHRYKG